MADRRWSRSIHALGLSVLAAAFAATSAFALAASEIDAPVLIQGASDLSARLTVPVTIGTAGPYQFVVDTAAERTVISRELAGRLALGSGRDVTLISISGVSQVRTVVVPLLRLTSSRIQPAAVQAPMMAENDLGASGLLGIDSLRAKRVVMDFKAMRMTIQDAATPLPAVGGEEIVVTARRKLGQLILVDCTVRGLKVNVIIDTGSAVTIGNPALRAKLGQRGAMRPPVPISIISVTGGRTIADYTAVNRVRLGGVKIDDLPVAFADVELFHRLGLSDKPALLLGMDVLRGFDRVSVDFANRKVRFLLPGEALQTPAPVVAIADRPIAG